ncbi:alpha-ketoglutarate-dependent dioxygenase alkB homolog 7, mitochondrial [Polypterus senegalus]|uniref:alpha-ketoglutarate-dependent dioxygenase alkB homolog 7, mitochondrial n=1 Tax=Polypterus senegalus TaxID=55291 RepID=UPI001966859D|nr:alpha-ketoglutarate-dependent dioxygenase alkB homolog 7, mitochondrial [Polypterus senegalus]
MRFWFLRCLNTPCFTALPCKLGEAAARAARSFTSTQTANRRGIAVSGAEIREDFISEEEERALLEELEPVLKRKRYEYDHWDDAIHGYRETERSQWNEKNSRVLQRVRDVAFPPGVKQLHLVHVLDLHRKGYIKAHVDSVKFCGSTIAGICLLSSSVMRLISKKIPTDVVDLLLPRRCLYILRDEARYSYTHEILKDEESYFNGVKINRDRRISVICRNLSEDNAE